MQHQHLRPQVCSRINLLLALWELP
jgi:hypothetical protein